MSLKTENYPTFAAELRALGESDAERAEALGLTSPHRAQRVWRLRQRLPGPCAPLLNVRLLRALLTDLESQNKAA